ncbi:HET-domain-containing protein [Copromyces sp. CBS 386.78]|nr:HET-domain-containing protein [Copromyces sp. CBS 386.78]
MAQLDASDVQLLFFGQFLLLSLLAALYSLFQAWRNANNPSKTHKDTGDLDMCSKFQTQFQPRDDRSDKFLPEGMLREFLTRQIVSELLIKDLPIHDIHNIHDGHNELKKVEELIDFTMSEQDNELGKRIFATALFCGFDDIQLRTAIQDFRVYKQNHPDFKLPITSSDAFFTSSGRKSDKVWTEHKKNSFCDRQWTFLAPVLFPNMKNPILKLEPRHILPWIKEDQKLIGSGSFGEVRQVTPSQSNIVDPAFQGSPIAVKALKNVDKGDDEENDVQNSRNEWDREVRTHINIKNMKDGKGHAHIIPFFGAIEKGTSRYLLFQWADGGNLRDFWKSHPNPTPTAALVEKFLHQLRGIADALYNLHTFKRDGCEDGSYRHGDLKPENILSVGSLKGDFGTLMVSDLGLAKHHPLATNLRRHQTSTEATTWRYQPPEVSIEEKKSIGRSRRYDIWSMGCVTLEFIIWLLYGNDILNQFNDSINKPTSRPCLPDFNRSPWFTTDDDTNTARLHDSVKKTISIILKKDPECQGPEKTALHSLIELVRDRLLVVDLGSEAELARAQTFAYMKSDASASTPEIRVEQVDANERNVSPPVSHSSTGRATSEEFLLAVNKIVADGSRNPSYWFTGKPREHVRAEIESHIRRLAPNHPGSRRPTHLRPEVAESYTATRPPIDVKDYQSHGNGDKTVSSLSTSSLSTQVYRNEYQKATLLDRTEFFIDNKFAQELLGSPQTDGLFPKATFEDKLCDKCHMLDLFEPTLKIRDSWKGLEQSQESCRFCALRLKVALSRDPNKKSHIILFDNERASSLLRLNEDPDPAISICRSPGFDTPESNRLQIGFPDLTVSDSQQFGLMRQWLDHCDSNPNHKCKPPPNSPLPTRVIDLGSKAEPSLRLYETQPGDSFKFIALSHRWGDEAQGHFRTTRSNYSAHTQAIPFEQLPMNFQDAIRVTRELDIRYLWIDSICIIQGIGGDFTEEAKRMESVFSSAYCVVAASSAHNQHEGFLKTRKKWDYVTLTSKKLGSNKEVGAGEIYVGPFRDDFKEHAINSPLSGRGWVLQERALARRTIYFTEWQMYWECGNGIRCESLAKMDNKLLAFLGDPNFPSKLSGKQSDRGEKIRFYEGLYSQYSHLTLTRPADRPIAIAGLEERLIRDLDGCSGGFGVFDDKQSLLPRSLLWQRDSRFPTLEKIDKINVPTWSWMAYQGGIDYMDVPLGGVDWDPNVTEIKGNWNGTTGHTEQMELNAKTRDFEMGRLGTSEFDIVFDIPRKHERLAMTEGAPQPPSFRKLKCVLLGRIKGHGDPKDLTHYVLVVALGKPKPTSRPSLMPSSLKPGDQPQMETYERVGVGKMAGRFIDFTEDKSQLRIWVTIR